ncbi:MAG: BON domain-containing protein [Bryobacterales bacterium]|nr:BON domain-containing protein [Bryobacterales bacterium]
MKLPDKRTCAILGSLGIGAGLMYLLDPSNGKRRRSIVRDKARKAYHTSGRAAGRWGRRIANRGKGALSEVKARWMGEDISDSILEARVRSHIGHHVSRLGWVEITARNGVIVVTGSLPKQEAATLLAQVEAVRGVKGVDDRLNIQSEGNGRSKGWARTMGMVASAVGSGLALYGVRRRGVQGTAPSNVGRGAAKLSGWNQEAVPNQPGER